MKVAFLSNKLTLRGTEVALYDYAHHNETLLGNKSLIITRPFSLVANEYDADRSAYVKFGKRFDIFFYKSVYDIDVILKDQNVDVLYIIKSGYNDGLLSTKFKTVIHCVFDAKQEHGDVYAVISNNVNVLSNTHYPVVPHMISLPNIEEDLRKELNIPSSAIVFGRYGGRESFDIGFVKDAVCEIAQKHPNIYFLFMNTYIFCTLSNVIFLPGTDDLILKRKFINTCDALLHARERGETFGLTCGEFASCDKNVISFGNSKERNHLDILGDKALLYTNEEELLSILTNFENKKLDMSNNGFKNYTPEKVMKIFEQTFLN